LEKLNSRLKNNKGSAIIFIAILLPIFLLIIGMVVDIGRAFTCKEEINRACMIAAEESSKYINIEMAQNYGINNLSEDYTKEVYYFFNNNYSEKPNSRINYLGYSVQDSLANPKYIEVSCEAEIDCFFLKLISIENIKVHSKANGRLRRIN
jgi:hypothetical protein